MDPAGRAQRLSVHRRGDRHSGPETRSSTSTRRARSFDRIQRSGRARLRERAASQPSEMYRSPKPRHSRSIGRIIAALVFAAVPLRAVATNFPDETYHSLPCRPTIACTADFVPPGVVELEMGYIYRRLGIGANQHSAPFLLKLTLADWVQLQFGSNGLTRASQPAPAFFFDDVTLGLKFHLS